MNTSLSSENSVGNILLYTTPNWDITVEALLSNENVWLSQKRMSELFGVVENNITYHLQEIFKSWELDKEATTQKFWVVQKEGNRSVKREVLFYNLDAIIAVGYRVNSLQATQFRIWATNVLKEYIIKGFSMDDQRLKNGQHFGKDFFEELLERVRSIRASERRIWQKITDIFAECSLDYDPTSDITNDFYAMVQNKFHYAITGKTAAEIVYSSVDQTKPHMGLTTRKNAPKGRILKSDTTIAKNYLQPEEIKKLERTISSYFDYIENQIEQKKEFTMASLANSVNKFLEFNDFGVLDGKGKISHQQAKNKAYKEYEEFNPAQKIESDFDKLVKKLKKK